MTVNAVQPFKIAILRNYLTQAPWGQDMVDSWYHIIQRLLPDAVIAVFHPVDGGPLPIAAEYDLIILTGGNYNLLPDTVDPWVSQTLQFVRTTSQQHPNVKILGVCWGHQAIVRAMGGQLGNVKTGQYVGVQDVALTAKGKAFFKPRLEADIARLHKFHKRAAVAPPPGFIALADDNEILLSEQQNILCFQGHPEMTALVATHILDADDGPFTAGRSKSQIEEMYEAFQRPHDGVALFANIFEWARR